MDNLTAEERDFYQLQLDALNRCRADRREHGQSPWRDWEDEAARLELLLGMKSKPSPAPKPVLPPNPAPVQAPAQRPAPAPAQPTVKANPLRPEVRNLLLGLLALFAIPLFASVQDHLSKREKPDAEDLSDKEATKGAKPSEAAPVAEWKPE